jgi:hypothetical protein
LAVLRHVSPRRPRRPSQSGVGSPWRR